MDRKLLADNALTFSKYLIKFYIPAFVGALVIVEAGLRLSHVLQPGPSAAVATATDTNHRILLVSDSSVGTIASSSDAAGKFVQKLTNLYGDKVAVSELSRGGLLTTEVEAQLEDRVRKTNSSTVILMVGKSDWVRGWVDKNFGHLAQSWVASLETAKLLLVIMVEIQKHLTSVWPDRAAVAEYRALVLPWKLYSTQDIRGISAFESALLEFPNSIRAIRSLVHLYYIHAKIPEGVAYLKKLTEVSDEADFVRLQIANMNFDFEKRTRGDVPAQIVSEWDEAIKSLPSQRLGFLARMRYLMRTRNVEEFAHQLRNMSPEQSDVLLPSTYSTLIRVIQKAVSMGLRVIVLEYPSNHGVPLERVLASHRNQVEFYETRKWLLDSVPDSRLITVFEVDIEHLTTFGADVFAENMVRVYREGPAKGP